MRLGWVVGQAGLWVALVIIILSHIISVTTGLSISSIATDKKIKAGGIYYILSRSLGLPMGGSIGIALTIGTALSISMYIVGFTENFLSIPQIADFIGFSFNIQAVRIIGSIVLAVLVIIAMISTSLAIKTQYFILTAIAVSLISIFAGFFINVEFHPTIPVLSYAKDHASPETIFAIFFPAVTGFTAGVAMSGDLKNPKKNIPIGTLLAIAVGFIVYISLAVGFAFFVKRDILISDNNVAMHVSWNPALVVAGIWGATLSSALGGILGGPRILQALSQDKVTPRFFAKGYGPSNEPRNALLLIYLVAESGILIGDLNVIAGVVTMFYLTSYGFINLAYVLESWANTDFRPSFKVSIINGIIGFVFAFLIMLKLDFISMLLAFVIIGVIFLILERRQISIDKSNVWQSVWFSIIRRGLSNLNGQITDDTNWQPNIILFSGGTNQRPYLMEFSKSLVGNFGFLTNFDLIVDKNADVLFPKYKQAVKNKEFNDPGVFLRRQTVKDIYDGIEMIARTYGFSGIDPNTVILGWARNSKNPSRFVKLLQTLNSLDYNVVLMDYDTRYKFGKYSRIDIWWRGAGNNGNFALTLAKLMLQSEKWQNAQIRLMIVNDDDSKSYYLYRRANEVLNTMRIQADVKIVNNEVEQRSFYDIVRNESKTSDLVFIGIPYISEGQENDFVANTNRLLFEIGTVVLVRASTLFKEMNLGVNLRQKNVLVTEQSVDFNTEIISERLYQCRHTELFKQIANKLDTIIEIYEKTIQSYVYRQSDDFEIFLEDWDKIFADIFKIIKNNLPKLAENQRDKYVFRYQKYLINKLNLHADKFKRDFFEPLFEQIETVVNEYLQLQSEFFKSIKNDIKIYFKKDEIKSAKSKKILFLKFKSGKFLINSEKDTITVLFTEKERKRILVPKFLEILFLDVEQIRIETLRFIYNFESFYVKMIKELSKLSSIPISELVSNIEELQNLFDNEFQAIKSLANNLPYRLMKHRKLLIINVLNSFLKDAESIDKFLELKQQQKNGKQEKYFITKIDKEISIFFESFDKYMNQIELENFLLLFKLNSRVLLKGFVDFIESSIHQNDSGTIKINDFIDKISQLKKSFENLTKGLPKQITIMDAESLNDSFYKDFSDVKKIDIKLMQKITAYVQQEIINKISNEFVKYSEINAKEAERLIEIINEILEKIENFQLT